MKGKPDTIRQNKRSKKNERIRQNGRMKGKEIED